MHPFEANPFNYKCPVDNNLMWLSSGLIWSFLLIWWLPLSQDDFKFLTLLPQPPQCWDYTHGCACRVTCTPMQKMWGPGNTFALTLCHCICMTQLFFLSFFFETGSNITQAGLKLGSCLQLPGARITGVHHNAWLLQLSLSQIINVEIPLPLAVLIAASHFCMLTTR